MRTTKEDVARQFGRTAEAYAVSETHARGRDLTLLVEMLHLEPSMEALDIATGAGHMACALAPHVRNVLAVDLTPEMVGQTEKLAASRGLGNVRAAVMDSEALDLPDSSFDVVTCRIAPHYFLHIEAAVGEMSRVLKPGGQLGLEDTISPADPELDRFLNEVEVLRDPTHIRNYTAAEWTAMLEAVGLKVRRTEVVRKSHDVAGWIERSARSEEGQEDVYAALAQAPPHARQYFDLHYTGGRASSFTMEQMLFLVVKNAPGAG